MRRYPLPLTLALAPNPNPAPEVLTGRARAGAGAREALSLASLILFSLGALAGCDRMVTPPQVQLAKDGDAKAAAGEYAQAINLYESALDGTAASADVHYKLGLIYDDKLNDPLNALHHFKRFLTLEPTGKRAQEVKEIGRASCREEGRSEGATERR